MESLKTSIVKVADRLSAEFDDETQPALVPVGRAILSWLSMDNKPVWEFTDWAARKIGGPYHVYKQPHEAK